MATKTIGRVRPGLSLNSKQIRSRLRNRTIDKRNPMTEEYIQSEELIKIQKMNKVEREMSARANLKEMEEIQKRMEKTSNKQKQKMEEQRIEELANKRIKEMRDAEANKKE